LAPTASGAANLTSVTSANHRVTANWTLPATDSAVMIEVSLFPTFPDELGTGTGELVGPDATTGTTSDPLPGGHYYVRVVTFPCAANPPCDPVYSNLGEVTIPSDAAKLLSVTQSGGVVSAAWSLTPAASAFALEVSTYPDRGVFGFLEPPVIEDALGFTETSYTAPAPLPPGLYYVHVITTPTLDSCLNVINGCAFEFSNLVAVRVPGATSSAQSAQPPPAVDKVVSLGAITASSKQDVDKLSITLNTGEAVKVKLSGSVSVSGASKVYRFKTVNKSVGAGKTKLSLKLASKAKKVVKRALRRKKRLRAKLTLVVTDNAGNAQTKKYTVRLKP
jgi:hypothetical protein